MIIDIRLIQLTSLNEVMAVADCHMLPFTLGLNDATCSCEWSLEETKKLFGRSREQSHVQLIKLHMERR